MLTDRAHQEEVWLSAKAPGYDCYSEALEVFHETWNLFNHQPAKDQLTPAEFKILSELYLMIKQFHNLTYDQESKEVLNDPRWESIRQKGSDLLQLLEI